MADIAGDLKCPNCQEMLQPPITVCENNHNVCGNCKPTLNSCIRCGGLLSETRNYDIENLIRMSTITPPLTPTDCLCPFTNAASVQCSWSGKLEEVKKHVMQLHDKKVVEKSGKFSMTFTDVSTQASYMTVMYTMGEVFVRRAQLKDNIFYLAVLYVGPMKNVAKYKYTFNLNKKNGVESVTVCQRTRSFTENCEDVFKSGSCIKLHYDVISEFMLDNCDLPNVMEISKV
jgi:Seven in absentia protein family.